MKRYAIYERLVDKEDNETTERMIKMFTSREKAVYYLVEFEGYLEEGCNTFTRETVEFTDKAIIVEFEV